MLVLEKLQHDKDVFCWTCGLVHDNFYVNRNNHVSITLGILFVLHIVQANNLYYSRR